MCASRNAAVRMYVHHQVPFSAFSAVATAGDRPGLLIFCGMHTWPQQQFGSGVALAVATGRPSTNRPRRGSTPFATVRGFSGSRAHLRRAEARAHSWMRTPPCCCPCSCRPICTLPGGDSTRLLSRCLLCVSFQAVIAQAPTATAAVAAVAAATVVATGRRTRRP